MSKTCFVLIAFKTKEEAEAFWNDLPEAKRKLGMVESFFHDVPNPYQGAVHLVHKVIKPLMKGVKLCNDPECHIIREHEEH